MRTVAIHAPGVTVVPIVCACFASFDDPAITFAHAFGETGGYGPEKDAAYAVLVEAQGAGPAKAVHALCRYIMWGGRTGNTIQGFFWGTMCCKPRPDRPCVMVPLQVLFELIIVAWYFVLFLILIPVVGKVFKHVFPKKIPSLLAGVIGSVLVTVAGLFIVPMGIIGGVTYPFQLMCNTAPPKKASKGCKAVSAEPTSISEEAKEDVPVPEPIGTAIP